jgi:hypothetical protein
VVLLLRVVVGTHLEGGIGGEVGGDPSAVRLRLVGQRLVAVLWTLGGVAGLVVFHGTPRIAALGPVLLGIALLRWPVVVRWAIAGLSIALVAFAALMRWYFRDLLTPHLIVWFALGAAGHVLLLFGKMTWMRLVLGAALLISYVLGDPRTKAGTSADDCAKRVDALNAKVAAYLRPMDVPVSLHAASVPTTPDGPLATASYPVLEVATSGKWFQSRLPDEPDRAARELSDRLERLQASPSDVPTFYLAADASQPVQEIGAVLAHVPRARVFILARASNAPPPGAQGVPDRLAGARTNGEMATILADELGRRAGPCAPLAKRLVLLNDTPPERRPSVLAASLDQGLRECQCGPVDIEALEYVLMRLLRPPGFDYFAYPVPHDHAGRLRLPGEPELKVEEWIHRL